jgi:hypothetical protein
VSAPSGSLKLLPALPIGAGSESGRPVVTENGSPGRLKLRHFR